MGKKSTKENKNVYQLSRENLGLTREAAEALLCGITADRIEKIESGKSLPHPDEVLAMQEGYKNPELCNYFCSHECPIGRKYVPEVKIRDLSQISLEVLASLNALEKQKSRLIEITVDGIVHENEKEDFYKIQENLAAVAATTRSLEMWVEHALDTGKIE